MRSIVIEPAVTATSGPALPARSETVDGLSARTTVPAEQPATATVYVEPEPDGAPATHPVAVPVTAKSTAARPVTDSLNFTV